MQTKTKLLPQPQDQLTAGRNVGESAKMSPLKKAGVAAIAGATLLGVGSKVAEMGNADVIVKI